MPEYVGVVVAGREEHAVRRGAALIVEPGIDCLGRQESRPPHRRRIGLNRAAEEAARADIGLHPGQDPILHEPHSPGQARELAQNARVAHHSRNQRLLHRTGRVLVGMIEGP
jgi:hypothetical protein